MMELQNQSEQMKMGNIISTTTTDENGKYQFDNLNSGNYIVHFDKPSGMTQTTTDSGDDDEQDAGPCNNY